MVAPDTVCIEGGKIIRGRCRRPGEGDTGIAIQEVLAVIEINRSVRFKGRMEMITVSEIHHGKAFFSCIDRHHGPVTTSCFTAVVASSETVALASTVVSSSAYNCHSVAV